jgi:hypothetical protein
VKETSKELKNPFLKGFFHDTNLIYNL